jgi:hypothetical protein
MLIQAHRKLGVINADIDGWTEQVREHIENGNNFFLMMRKDAESAKNFCWLFSLPDDCKPRALTQAEFFLMSQFVEADAFDSILHHWDDKHQLIFVEQIDFPINRPPRLKHFIVYSPVLGIIAHFDRLNRAKEVLEDYQDTAIRGAPNAEAAVYIWEKERWCLFEGR